MVTLYMFIMRFHGIKRLENENNGRVVLLDTNSWRATKKHSAGRSLPAPGLLLFLFTISGINRGYMVVKDGHVQSSSRQCKNLCDDEKENHVRTNYITKSYIIIPLIFNSRSYLSYSFNIYTLQGLNTHLKLKNF